MQVGAAVAQLREAAAAVLVLVRRAVPAARSLAPVQHQGWRQMAGIRSATARQQNLLSINKRKEKTAQQ